MVILGYLLGPDGPELPGWLPPEGVVPFGVVPPGEVPDAVPWLFPFEAVDS